MQHPTSRYPPFKNGLTAHGQTQEFAAPLVVSRFRALIIGDACVREGNDSNLPRAIVGPSSRGLLNLLHDLTRYR
jgi:hypothetical protein